MMRRSEANAKRLSELGAEVSSSLEGARAKSAAAARVRTKLVAREVPRLRLAWRASRITPNFRFALVAGLTLAATIAVTAFFAWPRHPEARRSATSENLSFVVGGGSMEARGTTGAFVAAPSTASVPITFSDGSKFQLAPAARLRVAEVAHAGARVLVESGSVHVSVVHRDDETRWAVEAGPFEIRVTGTAFDVAYDPNATGLVVRMAEGSVFVRGCGLLGDEGQRLTAGEQLRVSCKDKTLSLTAATETDHGESDHVTPEAGAPMANATASAASPSTSTSTVSHRASATPSPIASAKTDATRAVVALAQKGAHAEALAEAEANGFAATCAGLSGPELLLLVDAARYAGRFDRATEALEMTRRRFAGSDAAATAAFELGRIAMDIRHDLGAAGDLFETYLRERPDGSLAREALGRAIEARSRAGDSARAERLAVRYLATYPDGPHAKLARKLSSPDSEPRHP
jgi:transmembrane sensor